MKVPSIVVAVSLLGLPLQARAAQPEAAPPAAAAPEAAPPPSADPAASTAPPPVAAEPATVGEAPPVASPDAAAPVDTLAPAEAPPPVMAAPPVMAPPPVGRDSISGRIKANPELLRRYRSAKGLALGGGITAGVGLIVGLTGASIAVEASGPDENAQTFSEYEDSQGSLGPEYRTAGLVMVGIGATFFVGGLAVMSLGLIKRKDVIRDAHSYPPVAIAPWGGKHGGGAALTGRF